MKQVFVKLVFPSLGDLELVLELFGHAVTGQILETEFAHTVSQRD